MRYDSRTLGSRHLSADIGRYRGYNIFGTKMERRSRDDRQRVLALVEQVKSLHQEILRLRQAASPQAPAADELAKLQESLEDAIAEVVHHTRPLVSKVIRHLVSHQQDAEDISQEVLIEVVKQLRESADIHSFPHWVVRLTANKVCEHFKKIKKQLPAKIEADLRIIESLLEDEETDSIWERTPSPDPPTDMIVIQRDLASRIGECLQAVLSDDECTVFSLHAEGYSHEQIAVLMERKATCVRQIYKRALAKAVAAVLLDPNILTNEEIKQAIEQSQRSENPEDRLTEAELCVLRDTVLTHPRKPPRWHQINIFRDACLKVRRYINIKY